MTAPAAWALAVYGLFLGLAFGLRTLVQLSRSAPSGVVATPGAAGRLADVLSGIGVAGGLAAPLLALGRLQEPLPCLVSRPLQAFGLALAVAGLTVAIAAQLAMGDSWRTGVKPGEHTRLVTSGAFAVVRNPFFSGWFLLALGTMLLVPSAVAATALLALVAGATLQVRSIEEPHLRRLHGDAYAAYESRTGRFLPRLSRRPMALHGILARAALGLGILHMLATPLFVPAFGAPALWFASGGGALVLVSVLNLSYLRYDGAEPALIGACILANLGALVFLVLLAAVEPVWLGNPTYVALVLVAALSVLSVRGR